MKHTRDLSADRQAVRRTQQFRGQGGSFQGQTTDTTCPLTTAPLGVHKLDSFLKDMGPSRNPRTAIFALVGVAVLIAIIYALTTTFSRDGDLGTPVRSATRTAPVDAVPPPDAGPGSAVYDRACVACHGTSAANAPEFGDKAAWEPRLVQGIDRLLQTVIAGKGAMPPRGTCADCSDDDLQAAIEYMLVQVGYEPVASHRNDECGMMP